MGAPLSDPASWQTVTSNEPDWRPAPVHGERAKTVAFPTLLPIFGAMQARLNLSTPAKFPQQFPRLPQLMLFVDSLARLRNRCLAWKKPAFPRPRSKVLAIWHQPC
jgi:hypothetical protein